MKKIKNIIIKMTALFVWLFITCKKDQSTGPKSVALTDIDGNKYKTIKIGDQEWMAENLKTTKLNDGTPIPIVSDPIKWANVNLRDPMACYYNNDEKNMNKYGLFYNWYSVRTGKLAPIGWHVATEEDWKKLRDYLIENGFNYDATIVENKIGKSLAAISGWETSQTIGNVGNDQALNNKSGFNALSSSVRSADGLFSRVGWNAKWWTSNTMDNQNAAIIFLRNNSALLEHGTASYKGGLNVRCVKD